METCVPYELVVSICAVVIAVGALTVSIQQMRYERRHNMLSVRPRLQFETESLGSTEKFQLKLRNCGIGPAVITHMNVSIDGNTLQQDDPLLDFLALIKAGEIVGGGEQFTCYTKYATGEIALLPGNEILLLELGRNEKIGDEELEAIHRRLIPQLKRLNIKIDYQSMYGKEDESFQQTLREVTPNNTLHWARQTAPRR